MPRDVIEREAAKAPLINAIAKAFERNAGNSLEDFYEREMFRRDVEEYVASALDALPSASAAEGAEGKPPMLLAKRNIGMGLGSVRLWMTRREADWSSQWRGSDDCDYKSRDLVDVDRTASDAEALRMYDADLK